MGFNVIKTPDTYLEGTYWYKYKPLESEVKQSKFRKIDRYKLPITTCPYSPKHNGSEPGNILRKPW